MSTSVGDSIEFSPHTVGTPSDSIQQGKAKYKSGEGFFISINGTERRVKNLTLTTGGKTEQLKDEMETLKSGGTLNPAQNARVKQILEALNTLFVPKMEEEISKHSGVLKISAEYNLDRSQTPPSVLEHRTTITPEGKAELKGADYTHDQIRLIDSVFTTVFKQPPHLRPDGSPSPLIEFSPLTTTPATLHPIKPTVSSQERLTNIEKDFASRRANHNNFMPTIREFISTLAYENFNKGLLHEGQIPHKDLETNKQNLQHFLDYKQRLLTMKEELGKITDSSLASKISPLQLSIDNELETLGKETDPLDKSLGFLAELAGPNAMTEDRDYWNYRMTDEANKFVDKLTLNNIPADMDLQKFASTLENVDLTAYTQVGSAIASRRTAALAKLKDLAVEKFSMIQNQFQTEKAAEVTASTPLITQPSTSSVPILAAQSEKLTEWENWLTTEKQNFASSMSRFRNHISDLAYEAINNDGGVKNGRVERNYLPQYQMQLSDAEDYKQQLERLKQQLDAANPFNEKIRGLLSQINEELIQLGDKNRGHLSFIGDIAHEDLDFWNYEIAHAAMDLVDQRSTPPKILPETIKLETFIKNLKGLYLHERFTDASARRSNIVSDLSKIPAERNAAKATTISAPQLSIPTMAATENLVYEARREAIEDLQTELRYKQRDLVYRFKQLKSGENPETLSKDLDAQKSVLTSLLKSLQKEKEMLGTEGFLANSPKEKLRTQIEVLIEDISQTPNWLGEIENMQKEIMQIIAKNKADTKPQSSLKEEAVTSEIPSNEFEVHTMDTSTIDSEPPLAAKPPRLHRSKSAPNLTSAAPKATKGSNDDLATKAQDESAFAVTEAGEEADKRTAADTTKFIQRARSHSVPNLRTPPKPTNVKSSKDDTTPIKDADREEFYFVHETEEEAKTLVSPSHTTTTTHATEISKLTSSLEALKKLPVNDALFSSGEMLTFVTSFTDLVLLQRRLNSEPETEGLKKQKQQIDEAISTAQAAFKTSILPKINLSGSEIRARNSMLDETLGSKVLEGGIFYASPQLQFKTILLKSMLIGAMDKNSKMNTTKGEIGHLEAFATMSRNLKSTNPIYYQEHLDRDNLYRQLDMLITLTSKEKESINPPNITAEETPDIRDRTVKDSDFPVIDVPDAQPSNVTREPPTAGTATASTPIQTAAKLSETPPAQNVTRTPLEPTTSHPLETPAAQRKADAEKQKALLSITDADVSSALEKLIASGKVVGGTNTSQILKGYNEARNFIPSEKILQRSEVYMEQMAKNMQLLEVMRSNQKTFEQWVKTNIDPLGEKLEIGQLLHGKIEKMKKEINEFRQMLLKVVQNKTIDSEAASKLKNYGSADPYWKDFDNNLTKREKCKAVLLRSLVEGMLTDDNNLSLKGAYNNCSIMLDRSQKFKNELFEDTLFASTIKLVQSQLGIVVKK